MANVDITEQFDLITSNDQGMYNLIRSVISGSPDALTAADTLEEWIESSLPAYGGSYEYFPESLYESLITWAIGFIDCRQIVDQYIDDDPNMLASEIEDE